MGLPEADLRGAVGLPAGGVAGEAGPGGRSLRGGDDAGPAVWTEPSSEAGALAAGGLSGRA